MPNVTLFAGPSAYGVDAASLLDGGAALRPPARRGDVDRLLETQSAPGVVVLCDGTFQSHPAVSHAELCRALDAGWSVWGVSSLGAIRAFELRDEGMRGYGYVHAQFALHRDFTDDEMCLLHFPETPYFPVSEPLVNLRHALETHGDALGISRAAAEQVTTALKALWFGDRTMATMRDELLRADVPAGRADELLRRLETHRIKAMDLAGLMSDRPWLDEAGAPSP